MVFFAHPTKDVALLGDQSIYHLQKRNVGLDGLQSITIRKMDVSMLLN